MSKKIILLDRDGVINEYPGDGEYVLTKEALRVFPYVAASLKKLKQSGFLVFIISNQACVSKGLITDLELKSMTESMLFSIESQDSKIDGVYYCTHREEENCPYRKPNTGIIDEIFKKLGFDERELKIKPFFIGDSIRDVEFAKRAGLTSGLVLSGREKADREASWAQQPDYIFKDLEEAVGFVIDNQL